MKERGSSPSDDLQRLWLALSRIPWRSLALVPASTGVNVVDLADRLVAIARVGAGGGIDVLSALGASLEEAPGLIDDLAAKTERFERVLVPTDAVAGSPGAIAVARGSSAALLVVRLGQTRLAAARQVVTDVGVERFVGSVVVEG